MNTATDLSIVVPVYNQKNYLAACMDSLLAELPARTEILLVDDGSTDGSAELCDTYGSRPEVKVCHQRNRGLAAARNAGLDMACGRYVGFCDSDDFVHPQMFRKLLYSVLKHDADMIVCGYVRTADRTYRLPSSKGYAVREIDADKAFHMLVSGVEPLKSYAWNKVIKKEIFTGLRYPEGRLYEDQFLTWRLVDRCSRVLMTEWPAYCYIDNPSSITNAGWSERELDYIDAWQEILDFCRREHPDCYGSARDQLVSAAAYSYSRLLKSGIRKPGAAVFLKGKILEYGHGYGSSHIRTVTGKRKLFVNSILARDKVWPGGNENRSEAVQEKGIYVEMSGRAGNQLFRYAFARWLMAQTGEQERLILDFSNIEKEKQKGLMEGWEDALKDFCVLPYETEDAGVKALDRLTTAREKAVLSLMKAVEYPLKLKGTLARLAFHVRLLPWLNSHGLYLLFVGYDYPFTAIPGQRKIISGPFECARYCEEIREILLQEFVPRYPLLEKNRELMQLITSTNSVCVTVRRGNYLDYKALNVCTKEYYERAALKLAAQVEDPVFFVFSDDVEWTRCLDLPGPVFYESGTDPVWEKLRLMSACRHFVISNSTFSWWAQFLGQAPDKRVMAPDHWFNGEYQPPLFEEGWQLVEVQDG